MAGPNPILLIGGSGQVGWELRRTLSPLAPVAAVGRTELDLASPDSIRRAVRDVGPSLIVNAGAYTAVDRAEDEEVTARAINGDAPGILAEEAKGLGIALVHYSTDYVFDGRSARPYKEDDPVAPLGAYGRSKLAGEEAIAAVGGAYVILRTSWIYSLRGTNFLLTIQRLAREREELRIVADQRGAPTWARMVAETTAVMLARCRAPGATGEFAEKAGVYHVAATGETSWHGFAEAIVSALRVAGETLAVRAIEPVTTANYSTPARRPNYSVLDSSKMAKTFGVVLPPWDVQLRLCVDED